MKPELLLFADSQSPSVTAQLERHFHCHHLWRVPAAERAGFLRGVAAEVRAVMTKGSIGIDAAQLAALPRLEIVAIHGAGLDAVDLEAARARGIRVSNTPGVLTDDVADLAVTLALASARRLTQRDRYVRAGDWERGAPLAPTRALRGKVAGIVGFGRIGQAVAARLAVFGMRLRYFQPRPLADGAVARSESLLALASESDYLVLCAPGGPATRGVVDAAVLAALGPQGTLINVARGSLVDQAALIAALREGTLGAAGLDVFEREPQVPAALRAMDNVVLTPHVGSLTLETREAMGQLVIANLLAHFAGQPLLTPAA